MGFKTFIYLIAINVWGSFFLFDHLFVKTLNLSTIISLPKNPVRCYNQRVRLIIDGEEDGNQENILCIKGDLRLIFRLFGVYLYTYSVGLKEMFFLNAQYFLI